MDFDDPVVSGYASAACEGAAGQVEKAVRLYYAVRDPVIYDPYTPFYRPEHYRASLTLKKGRGFCVTKAALLCALGRAAGIPSRVGFATVKNHFTSSRLRDLLGSDLFAYHGFTEFFLEGIWVKATPAFNSALCEKFGAGPLEFDGRGDSIFQEYASGGKKFMEYVEYHGSFADVPVDIIVEAWKKTYGSGRIDAWIKHLESGAGAGEEF
jgi:transglutaminase-like putative cysteine protease